ncbi:TolC family protein [Bacteroides sp.]|uniref:TolC family protein n=1 Tax=Bacteroides sp. TaxID=29523 RepID=UPI0025C21F3B|nr:TolC family protein [Bacteroides sp.]
MINVRRLTVITLCVTSSSIGGNVLRAQNTPAMNTYATPATEQTAENNSQQLPTEWTLQDCIDYALEQNITLRKSRINAESTAVDVKTAKAALFPSLSFSTSQNMVNRPYQESSSTVSGTEILRSNSKTSYNGNYGLNAQWTVYNGSKRLKTIEQEKLNNRVAELDVATSEKNIEESITQTYVQILYAAESVKVNESTLAVSEAQCDRGKELLAAGSLSKADLAQLEAQVSTDRYQLVTAQTTLQNYKLQLKQLLELDGEEEMNLYLPALDNSKVLSPLPTKTDVYHAALAVRPEIESGKLNIQASELNIDIARAGYMPSVSLSAGIGTNNTSGSDFTFAQQVKNGWNNSLGLSISVPIFNNRQTKSAVQKAKLQRETSMLNLLDEQKTLYKTIEGLWLDANSAQQRYVAAQEKLRSTQTSFDLVSAQFNLGMKNTVELLTEKNNLLSAQQETLQAKYMAILNAQLLKFYQGGDIEL